MTAERVGSYLVKLVKDLCLFGRCLAFNKLGQLGARLTFRSSESFFEFFKCDRVTVLDLLPANARPVRALGDECRHTFCHLNLKFTNPTGRFRVAKNVHFCDRWVFERGLYRQFCTPTDAFAIASDFNGYPV